MRFEHEVDLTVTWHDSCHMGRAGKIYEAPRQLIQAIPGIEFVEMEHNRQEAHCCGSVLSLVADPDVGERIGDIRLREAEDAGAEALVAACPCCEVQLRVTADKTGVTCPSSTWPTWPATGPASIIPTRRPMPWRCGRLRSDDPFAPTARPWPNSWPACYPR
jgi:Fe-S oxidoreductase